MRYTNTDQWDSAGGVLQTMIATLMSLHVSSEDQDDLEQARKSLQNAQECITRLGVYSKNFDQTIFFY
jgi:hypothetical protein